MSDTKQPYRMGMWEAFMFICGYVKRDRLDAMSQPAGLCKTKAEHQAATIQLARNMAAFEVAQRHFPNKFYSRWALSKGVGGVILYFSDNMTAEIVGDEAKAILEAD